MFDQVQAVSAVVGAIVVLVAAVQIPLRWQAHRFPELRSNLSALEAILHGSRDFTGEESKRAERELRDLIPQLRSKPVKAAAQIAYDEYKRAFAARPLASFYVLRLPETQEDRDRWERAALQEQHIAEAVAAMHTAIRRMTTLERWIVPSLK